MNLKLVGLAVVVSGSLLAGAAAAEPPEKVPPKAPATTPPAREPGREARVDLRPRFELGAVIRYSMKQVSDQTIPNAEDPKQPLKTRLEQTVGLRMTTKSVEKETGEATVEIFYETVKAKLDSAEMVVEFDSTKPPAKGTKPSTDPLDAIDNLVAEQFKRLVGTTMTMKVARDGRISSITGGESLAPTMLPGAAQVWGDAMKQLGGLFGPISSNSTAGFDGTARVGDRWTHTSGLTVAPLGGLDLVTTYDLRTFDRNSGLAKVFYTGHAQKKSSGETALISVEEAKHSGTYAWDTRLGQLVKCEMEQTVTMSGSLTGDKPSTAVTTLALERTSKKP